jgi:hypothetical protein
MGISTRVIEQLVPIFEKGGVRLVFNGHDHNLQVSQMTVKAGDLTIQVRAPRTPENSREREPIFPMTSLHTRAVLSKCHPAA